MDLEERSRRLQQYFRKIAPPEFDDRPKDTLESLSIPEHEAELATTGMERLEFGQVLERPQADALEAIVHKKFRPAIDIIYDNYHNPPAPWEGLANPNIKETLNQVIKSVGRIELPGSVLTPYGGTGFVVGPDIIMTNRHVAEIFASGIGTKNLSFRPNHSSAINFRREIIPESEIPDLAVEKVLMIHPHWDMALLRVHGLPEIRVPLRLSVVAPEDLNGRDIVVIGYPAQDDRNDILLQMQIYRHVFDVKRLQPGRVDIVRQIESYDHVVDALTHDASTLGGCSGAVVVDVQTGHVLGLHFAGEYLKANYAVPTFELARDARVTDFGLDFVSQTDQTTAWADSWRKADTLEASAPAVAAMTTTPSPIENGLSFTIPLQITVSVGSSDPIDQGAALSPVTTEGRFGTSDDQAIIDQAYGKFAIDSFTSGDFQWKLALATCALSHLIYSEELQVEDVCLDRWAFDECEFIRVQDVECMVASTPEANVVAFRGTTNTADWLRNLTLYSTNVPGLGRVHNGFYHGFQLVRSRLETKLARMGVDQKKLIVTGHSLGGALATIASAHWAVEPSFSLSGLYTFGQPAVGKEDFKAYVNSTFANCYFRFVYEKDIVTMVPPNYVHVGYRKKLGSGAEAFSTSDDQRMMSEAEFHLMQQRLSQAENTLVTTESLLPNTRDHALHRYLSAILPRLD